MFRLNNVPYLGIRVMGLERNAQVLDDDSTGRNKEGVMKRSIIGTYFNYKLTIDYKDSNKAEYYKLYNEITKPVESHKLKIPFNDGWIEFRAYVTAVADSLVHKRNGVTRWKGMEINFVALEPLRRASDAPGGGTVEGYPDISVKKEL